MARGRPKKFTLQELEKKIGEYWEYIQTTRDIPDIEGLALFLDTTRKTLLDYEKDEEFSYTIKKAKDKIFYHKKQLAFKGKINPTVFIFDAKNNHDYSDKQEIDQTIGNKDGKPFAIETMTPEERQARIAELLKKRENNL